MHVIMSVKDFSTAVHKYSLLTCIFLLFPFKSFNVTECQDTVFHPASVTYILSYLMHDVFLPLLKNMLSRDK